MTIVRNTLNDPGQAATVNRPIMVRLASAGFRPGDESQIISSATVRSDAAGAYELDLVPQSQIDPAGTHYVISHPDGSTWPIVVPDGAGPFWLRDILVEDPAVPGVVLAGLSEAEAATAVTSGGALDSALKAAYAPGGANRVREPLVQIQTTPGAYSLAAGVPVTPTITQPTMWPLWLCRDRSTLIGGDFAGHLGYSTDDGATWTTVRTFNGAKAGNVQAIRELDNGEILVFISTAPNNGTTDSEGRARAYLSSGWAANHATATYTLVLAMMGAAPENGMWRQFSMDTFGAIVVVNEYGPKVDATNIARYTYLSEDYGQTWRIIFDLLDHAPATGSHMHGAVYDPWWDAIWLTNGDGVGQYGNWVSLDWRNPVPTWTRLPIDHQFTSIYPMADAILFFSDIGTPNGIYRINRDRPGVLSGDWVVIQNAGVGPTIFGSQMFRANIPGAPLLISCLAGAFSDYACVYATHDGRTFRRVWVDTGTAYTNAGLQTMLGPTTTGKYVGQLTRTIATSAADTYLLSLTTGASTAPVPSAQSLTWHTGALAATYDRVAAKNAGANFTASGWLYVTAMPVSRTITTTSVMWFNGATAAGTPTHQWAVLLDANRKVIAVTADFTTTAIGANAAFTWDWTAQITIDPGLYYVGVMVAAGTIHTPWGTANSANDPASLNTPLLEGLAGSGNTIPLALGATAPAITGQGWAQLAYLL